MQRGDSKALLWSVSGQSQLPHMAAFTLKWSSAMGLHFSSEGRWFGWPCSRVALVTRMPRDGNPTEEAKRRMRLLITILRRYCATLAWQSYGDTRQTVANLTRGLAGWQLTAVAQTFTI